MKCCITTKVSNIFGDVGNSAEVLVIHELLGVHVLSDHCSSRSLIKCEYFSLL